MMREFSKYEKRIIRDKLIEGSRLSDMLDFKEKGELIAFINFDNYPGRHKFTFKSDTYNGQLAIDELVDLFDLLTYLLKEGYVRKYPDANTSFRDEEFSPEISLGDPNNGKAQTFLLNFNSRELGNFIQIHENYKFKATATLTAQSDRNFISQEEIRHNEIMKKATNANLIALTLSIITVLIGASGIGLQYKISKSDTDLAKNVIEKLSLQLKRDSLTNEKLKYDFDNFKIQIDSFKNQNLLQQNKRINKQ
ncbi:MAG TPA: hypothetical protein VIT44_15745 [Cyclobacteriaceae bacterium]